MEVIKLGTWIIFVIDVSLFCITSYFIGIICISILFIYDTSRLKIKMPRYLLKTMQQKKYSSSCRPKKSQVFSMLLLCKIKGCFKSRQYYFSPVANFLYRLQICQSFPLLFMYHSYSRRWCPYGHLFYNGQTLYNKRQCQGNRL